MQTKTKRTLSAVGAVVVALALAIGGTFAYTLREQKSNIITGKADYQARLVEDYDPNPKWEIDEEIKKGVSVKNMGGEKDFPEGNWGDIYVRVQIKEYMDIATVNYEYYTRGEAVRFMVDKSGDFVKMPATGENTVMTNEQLNSFKEGFDWTKVITDNAKREDFVKNLKVSDFVKLKGYNDDQDYWYLKTKDGDPNGQYGAWVVIDRETDTPTVLVGSTRGEYDTYEIHKWDDTNAENCGADSHKYIEWILGDSVVMLNDWNGQPVKAWILDPETGYATWGDALAPGEESDKILEKIKPIKDPDGDIYYDIYVVMEATDLLNMPDDWVIKDGSTKPDDLRFASSTVEKKVGQPDFSSPAINGKAIGDTVTDWKSSDTGVATVDKNGVVSIKGTGTTTITATVTHKDGTTTDISYILNVTDNSPEQTPAESVTINNADPLALGVGETKKLDITVTPNDHSDTPEYKSNNTAVATVDQNGNVTGISKGTAVVTVTLRPGVTAEITVNVSLPLLPVDGDGPFEARHDLTSLDGEFGMICDILKKQHELNYADGDPISQPCSIKLVDIFGEGEGALKDYSGITVTRGGVADTDFKIGADKSGDMAILSTYFGTREDWASAPPYPVIPVTLTLHKDGYADTTINVNLSFARGTLYA